MKALVVIIALLVLVGCAGARELAVVGGIVENPIVEDKPVVEDLSTVTDDTTTPAADESIIDVILKPVLGDKKPTQQIDTKPQVLSKTPISDVISRKENPDDKAAYKAEYIAKLTPDIVGSHSVNIDGNQITITVQSMKYNTTRQVMVLRLTAQVNGVEKVIHNPYSIYNPPVMVQTTYGGYSEDAEAAVLQGIADVAMKAPKGQATFDTPDPTLIVYSTMDEDVYNSTAAYTLPQFVAANGDTVVSPVTTGLIGGTVFNATFRQWHRYALTFNTTPVGTTNKVDLATLNLWALGSSGRSSQPWTNIAITPFTPTSNTAGNKQDYQTRGSVNYADNMVGEGAFGVGPFWTVGAYNNVTFNAAGRLAINRDNYTPLMVISTEDFNGGGLGLVASEYLSFSGANTAGTSQDPYMNIQYSDDATAFRQHVSTDIGNPNYAYINNSVSYRYYSLKFADTWGGTSYMGIRRVELQNATSPGVYASQFPVANNDTYVKATSNWSTAPTAGFFRPWFATNQSLSLTGDAINNSWISASGAVTAQRLNIDLGSAKLINRVYYQNFHQAGALTNDGVRNVTVWGSNTAGSFTDVNYYDNGGWTQLPIDPTQAPNVSFIAVPTSGSPQLLVNFIDSSVLGTPDNRVCLWEFGDTGTSDVCGSVAHVFSYGGVYDVNYSIISDGGSSFVFRSQYIIVSQSTKSQTAFYTPLQVRLKVVDMYGAPIPAAYIQINYIANSFPNTSMDFLQQAYGATDAVALAMLNSSVFQQGYTSNDGSISMLGFAGIQYGVQMTNASIGLNNYVVFSPKDTDYLFYCQLTGQNKAPINLKQQQLLTNLLYTTQVNATATKINLQYQDTGGYTTALTWTVQDWTHNTTVYTKSWAAPGGTLIIDNYTVSTYPKGIEYRAWYAATRNTP
jgi:PKD repeat protein